MRAFWCASTKRRAASGSVASGFSQSTRAPGFQRGARMHEVARGRRGDVEAVGARDHRRRALRPVELGQRLADAGERVGGRIPHAAHRHALMPRRRAQQPLAHDAGADHPEPDPLHAALPCRPAIVYTPRPIRSGDPDHATFRPRRRCAARRLDHDRLRPPRRGLLPHTHGRHGSAVRGERGGAGARLPARLGPGLGDGGIRHAAARHPYARGPRGRARQAIRPHPGDPAPDRPQPARGGGPRRRSAR